MTWYYYVALWVTGWWLISTACMRYTPRQCPRMKNETSWTYVNGKQKQITHRLHLDDDECWKRRHYLHVRPYDYAFWVGLTWPLWITLGAPALIIYALVMASGKVGRAEWYLFIEKAKARDSEDADV